MSILKGLGTLAAGLLVVGLASSLSAQVTQTKETAPAGAPKVTTVEVKGELVITGPNWLIAKNAAGDYKIYSVKAGRTFTIDGAPKTLGQLQPGTMLSAKVTTTETPLVTRTTKITQGKVFWSSSSSIIVTLEGGENKQYQVPADFRFDVDGKQLSAMELKPGMKLSATKIVEEPHSEFVENITVTGTAPKK
jgi:hypothetical protein